MNDNKKFTFEELSRKIKELKERGWIKYERLNHIKHDGLLGNVLEDLLGVKENNLKAPDFGKWEIKSKKEETSSRITLFNVRLTTPKKANTKIREKFGTLDEESGHNIINTSLSLNRWTKTQDKYKYTYMLKIIDDKLHILIKNKKTDVLVDEEYYWDIDKIKQVAEKKILHLCYAKGDIHKEERKVRFNSAEVYSGFQFEKIIELLKSHKIVFEFRIGVTKSGPKIGKTHDHGSAFRINKDCLSEIYSKHKKI